MIFAAPKWSILDTVQEGGEDAARASQLQLVAISLDDKLFVYFHSSRYAPP